MTKSFFVQPRTATSKISSSKKLARATRISKKSLFDSRTERDESAYWRKMKLYIDAKKKKRNRKRLSAYGLKARNTDVNTKITKSSALAFKTIGLLQSLLEAPQLLKNRKRSNEAQSETLSSKTECSQRSSKVNETGKEISQFIRSRKAEYETSRPSSPHKPESKEARVTSEPDLYGSRAA